MRWGYLLAASALLGSSPGFAASVDKIVQLSREGTNFDVDPAPNGDLHMVCRTGAGAQTNFKTISYFRYTKASDQWSGDTTVFVGDAFSVSADIDTNQPAIAFDPVNGGGGAWIAWSGNVRRDNIVPIYFVRGQDNAVFDQGNLTGLPAVREIRAVDIAVASDGHLWGCFNFTSLQNPADNGIYCNNDGGNVERATGRESAGEGLSVSLGPGGMPHIMTTFGRSGTNAAWSPRTGLSGLNWAPGALQFGGIPFSAGKVSCADTSDNNTLNCAAVTAQTTFGRFTFAFSMNRSGGTAQVVKGSAVSQWGVDVDPGDFNSESIKHARSAGGAEAIAYAMDADPQGGLDLGVVMIKPAGVDWPQTAFTDANGDGFHDEMAGAGQTPRQYFGSAGAEVQHVFPGTQGRATILFVTAETPTVAFSGEDLWVVYHIDDPVTGILPKGTRAAKISLGPAVPDLSVVGGLLLLLAFTACLVSIRPRQRAY